jgi:serine/threonine protein kinase
VSVFPEQKPVKFGRYILLDRINVGGMAEVFRGKSQGVEGFERLVALKRILPSISADEDFIEMFIDEAKLAVQCQHANIAQVYDLGKVDEAYYIAMEYVSGVDLRTMWDRARNRNRLLPIAMSCYVMQRACEGLDAAHRKKDQSGKDIGLVHRDVSPQNILVSFEGEVKVIDFGIAKSKSKVSKTQAGILKGKFGYMSPEQVRGTELDNRSDIFACGSILYELVVGDRLFLGESDFSTLEKVRNVEMVPPTRLNKNLSPHLERIVMKALAKNREDRYRWASEMAEDLQRYLFSSNQPFARTDLQRYMQQHFKEELEKEKDRLDKYKSVTFAQFEPQETSKPKKDPTRTAATEMQSGIDELRGELANETTTAGQLAKEVSNSGFKARPIAVSAAVLAEGSTSRPSLTPTPAVIEGSSSRLPPWAAGLIGGLIAVVLVALGVVWYLTHAKPAPGALSIEVTPKDAEIYVNDKLVSTMSPYTYENLPPGTYVLRVEKTGFQALIRAVAVTEGQARMESVVLEAKKGSASVVVLSKPAGLSVWVDGKDSGRVTPATIAELAQGEHQILIKRNQTTLHRVRVTLKDGAAEPIEVDVAKLPTILDVISEPPGASVRINGEPKGVTPATVPNVRGASLRVELDKEGCAKFEKVVTPERPSVTTVTAKLECGK